MCSWRVNWRTEKSLESNAACSPPGFFGVQVFQLNLAAQARRVSCMGRCYLLVGDGSPGIYVEILIWDDRDSSIVRVCWTGPYRSFGNTASRTRQFSTWRR